MSAETCGGKVVKRWDFKSTGYFLRDDRDAGLSVDEKYSLFRARPSILYGRVEIFAGFTKEAAIKRAELAIIQDQKELLCKP